MQSPSPTGSQPKSESTCTAPERVPCRDAAAARISLATALAPAGLLLRTPLRTLPVVCSACATSWPSVTPNVRDSSDEHLSGAQTRSCGGEREGGDDDRGNETLSFEAFPHSRAGRAPFTVAHSLPQAQGEWGHLRTTMAFFGSDFLTCSDGIWLTRSTVTSAGPPGTSAGEKSRTDTAPLPWENRRKADGGRPAAEQRSAWFTALWATTREVGPRESLRMLLHAIEARCQSSLRTEERGGKRGLRGIVYVGETEVTGSG